MGPLQRNGHTGQTPCWRANDSVAQGSTELFALQQGVFVLNVTASLQRAHSFSFHYRDKETSNMLLPGTRMTKRAPPA